MSETAASNPPARRWNWLKIALIASLAVNLLFGGAAVARFVAGDAPVRFAMLSQVQLVPRKFLGELDGERVAKRRLPDELQDHPGEQAKRHQTLIHAALWVERGQLAELAGQELRKRSHSK